MDTKAPNIALKVEGDPLSAAKSVIRTNEKYNVAESKSPSPWRPLGSSFLFDDKKINFSSCALILSKQKWMNRTPCTNIQVIYI